MLTESQGCMNIKGIVLFSYIQYLNKGILAKILEKTIAQSNYLLMYILIYSLIQFNDI